MRRCCIEHPSIRMLHIFLCDIETFRININWCISIWFQEFVPNFLDF
ncbi:hypothetical protein X975_19576, partial [Stegodyphus mimosarum]